MALLLLLSSMQKNTTAIRKEKPSKRMMGTLLQEYVEPPHCSARSRHTIEGAKEAIPGASTERKNAGLLTGTCAVPAG